MIIKKFIKLNEELFLMFKIALGMSILPLIIYYFTGMQYSNLDGLKVLIGTY